MESYVIIARSVTYAQRIERELKRAGIQAFLFRAPLELTGGVGCSYAVRVSPGAMTAAYRLLQTAGLRDIRILRVDRTGATEVSHDLF